MSYDYRIPQGRDKGKRTNGMFSLGGKLGSVLSALGNGEKLMQVRLWQNWEMVMGPDIAPLAWPLGARNDILIVGGEDNLALQEPPRPRQLGAHLEEMNPDSPVARCYAAYLRMHGVPTERKS